MVSLTNYNTTLTDSIPASDKIEPNLPATLALSALAPTYQQAKNFQLPKSIHQGNFIWLLDVTHELDDDAA